MYKNNIKFSLTEYQAVEISVMDSDPQMSAAIANDISNLVDTVFYNIKEKLSKSAFKLVEDQYMETEYRLVAMQDSLYKISSGIKRNMSEKGDIADKIIGALAEYGVSYMYMMEQMKYEVGIVNNTRIRVLEAKMEAEQDLPYKFVVEQAIVPEKKAFPNKSLIVVVSTLASLLFALIILIVIDNVKTRVAVIKEK
jgi:capsular polysaccharide biosynthesis protein